MSHATSKIFFVFAGAVAFIFIASLGPVKDFLPLEPGHSPLPASLTPAIAETLGRDDASYYFYKTGGGYAARNAAHHYTATIADAGARISGNNISFTLALKDAAYHAPSVQKNKISYARMGMEEWFVNGPLGLEQGFTVTERPSRGPLTLALTVTGGVALRVTDDARGVVIVAPAGDAVNYHGLVAYDATGRELSARFERQGAQLAIVVNDARARYPVVIDPFVQEQKLVASDGAASEYLGYRVSMSADGTRAIAGADSAGGKGAAYIFVRTGTAWTQEQKLTASDGAASDFFGIGAAMSGDGTRVIVGANEDNVGANTDQGSAYVFLRSGTVWSEEQKLTASDGAASDFLGFNVSINTDGTRVIVGSDADDVGANSNQGSAYVFSRSGTVWSEEQKLTASDGAASDNFGYNVAMSPDGTRVVAGAGGDDVGANSNQGSAYVFSRSGTVWSEEQKLTASDGAASDNFGTGIAVDTAGGRVIIGAVNDDTGSNSDQGSAYVFSRSGTVWSEEQKLTASDGAASDFFGTGIAINSDGTKAIVGAGNDDIGVNTNQGSAYIFSRSGTAWSEEQKLTPSDSAVEFFGHKVSMSSDGLRAMAGSYGADIGGNADQGAAYIFVLPQGGAGLSAFVRAFQSGFAIQYAARDTYTPRNLALHAEQCTTNSCAATLRFSAPEGAALERFSLRHGENNQRITFESEHDEHATAFIFAFDWPANAELPARLCYAHITGVEFCAEARIWTPVALTATDIVINSKRIDDRFAVDIRVPSFRNFSYLVAERSSVLIDARDIRGAVVFYERVSRPETRTFELPPGRYTVTLTPMNAAGDDGAPITLPLELLLPEPIRPPAAPRETVTIPETKKQQASVPLPPAPKISKPRQEPPVIDLAPAVQVIPPRLAPIIEVNGGRVAPAENSEQLLEALTPGNPLLNALRNLISNILPPAY